MSLFLTQRLSSAPLLAFIHRRSGHLFGQPQWYTDLRLYAASGPVTLYLTEWLEVIIPITDEEAARQVMLRDRFGTTQMGRVSLPWRFYLARRYNASMKTIDGREGGKRTSYKVAV
jgi:hypothetical protein